MADAIEGIAGVAAESVVEAFDGIRPGDTDNGFIGKRAEHIVGECRRTCGIDCLGLTSKRIVLKQDTWRVIRIDRVRKVPPPVIGVHCLNATRPGAVATNFLIINLQMQ